MDDGLPGWRSVCLCKDCWRNIAITLIDGVVSVIACLQQLPAEGIVTGWPRSGVESRYLGGLECFV
jgi:hypothetical protein